MKQHHSQTLLVIPAIIFALSGCASQRTILHGDAAGNEAAKSKNASAPAVSNLNCESGAASEKNVRIWFMREERGELRPAAVERAVGSDNAIQAATDQLLRGPTAEERKAGIQSEIPLGTVLIGVTDKGPIAELNLSQRFASGGESSMEARLTQLERTLKEVADKKKVFLDVEGHRLLTAGEGLEVKQPLNQ